jgi:hypothetical protein
LKPGKSADNSTIYRPISLLSPAVKVLERMLLPFLHESLPFAKTQHGYKPLHSTTPALLPLATQIAVGFDEPKPAGCTALVSLDISKAFDGVDHVFLLEKISNTDLYSNVVLLPWAHSGLPFSRLCLWGTNLSFGRSSGFCNFAALIQFFRE